jgi:hypothetical protein
MTTFQPIKDTLRYLWHDSATLRSCCKIITCPLSCPYYCLRACLPSGCVYIVNEKQLKRWAIIADIKHRKRVRQVGRRKRSVSVDGKKWYNSKAKDQSQSPFFAELPVELRLKIYEMVLCNREELAMKNNDVQQWDNWNLRAEPSCDAGMLRTCKKMFVASFPLLTSFDLLLTNDTAIARPLQCFTQEILSYSTPTRRYPASRQQYLRSASLRSDKLFSASHIVFTLPMLS